MSQVVRDFIPEGEDATAYEKAKHALARGGGGRPDFVPGPDHVKVESAGREGQAEEAMARAAATEGAAIRTEYRLIVERLANMNVAQAADYIQTAPFSVMETALAAETLHGHRKGVLERFPPVDPAVIKQYEAIEADDAAANAESSDLDGEE